MHDFYGTVRLLDEPDASLDAKVTLDLNKVAVRAGDTEIGSWPHSDVEVKKIDGEINLTADGETLVLKLDNGDFLLDLLGVDTVPPPSRKRRKKKTATSPPDRTSSTDGFGDLRAASAAAYDEDSKLHRFLAIGLTAAAVLILLGAALTWGPFRLMDPGSFPIGRVLAGFGGLGGLFGLYIAYFDNNRITGSAIAIAAGVVTFVIMYFYARAAHLGIGFMLALLGSLALIVAGAIGMTSRGGSGFGDED